VQIDWSAVSTWVAIIGAGTAIIALINQNRLTNFNTRLEILLLKEQLFDSDGMVKIRKKAADDIVKR
jgi:hypothetical protein